MAIPGWTEEDIYRVAKRAHSFYLQGRYDEAGIIFEGLVAIDPANRYCRLALAVLYMTKGKVQQAVAQLSDLLGLYPEEVGARARRCEAYLELGLLKEAEQDWEHLKKGTQTPTIWRLQTRISAT